MVARLLPGLAVMSLLVAGPALAQSNAASPSSQSSAKSLSLSNAPAVRAAAGSGKKSNAAGGNWGWIVGGIGLVAGVTYALVEGDDDDKPASN